MAVDKKSRYRGTGTRVISDPTGQPFEILALRTIPPTGGVYRVTAVEGDRLDLLAHRFYRDPTRFWTLCDAADHLDPFDLVAPGEQVLIPPDK